MRKSVKKYGLNPLETVTFRSFSPVIHSSVGEGLGTLLKLSKKPLPPPLGEVARKAGRRGFQIFLENLKNMEYLLCEYSINPLSHAAA